MSESGPLIQVRNLKKYYPITGGLLGRTKDRVKAVDDVSFDIHRGETLGIAGESGCGKTTVAETIVRHLDPTDGTIHYDGRDITNLKQRELRSLRADIGLVPQDPFSSLNPRMRVRDIVSEPLDTHRDMDSEAVTERVAELLDQVGLREEYMYRYPHEFSGGQRQRIAIARALALDPSFVVLDEPTSALDVSVQAKVLELLEDLQDEFDLTYLFITHNLSVMDYIADRILIMYVGNIVERGPTDRMFADPHHPYTEALLSAVPRIGEDDDPIVLDGDVPSPRNPPSGCVFHTRCPYASDACSAEKPVLNEIGENWESRCLFEDPRAAVQRRFDDESGAEGAAANESTSTTDD